MLPTDAISRIEMADKLLDHYTGVISLARAASRRRDGAEICLQIADANRVLDLIWEVLDDACGTLAASDRDISLYLRARERRVTQEREPVAGDGLPPRLSASLRHREAILAEEASEALKRALPERDWSGLPGRPAPERTGRLAALATRLFSRPSTASDHA